MWIIAIFIIFIIICLLCYNNCNQGYKFSGDGTIGNICEAENGNGCKDNEVNIAGVCYTKCEDGFEDTGLACIPKSYTDPTDLFGVPMVCPDGTDELSKGLCYGRCDEGYNNKIPGLCTQNCPPGSVDIGASCSFEEYFKKLA